MDTTVPPVCAPPGHSASGRATGLIASSLAELGEALQKGKSETLCRYLAMLARFHRYSYGNVLLIASQRPEATHVAGFHTWKKLGRYVKKGEKGILILAPVTFRRTKVGDEEVTDEAEDTETVLRFRGVYVFDVTQTDGEPLPTPAEVAGDPGARLARLRQTITARGISLDYDELPGGAEGVSRGGRISLRPGLTPAEEFSVLVHELAHELLHQGTEKPPAKAVRETEAEAVAFVVCHAIGLDTGTAASDYIQLYSGNTAQLAQSFDRIQRTAGAILEGMEPSG